MINVISYRTENKLFYFLFILILRAEKRDRERSKIARQHYSQSELTNGLVLEVDLLLLDLHPHPLLQVLVEGEGVDIPGGRVADPDSIGSVDPEGKNDPQKY